MISGILGKKLGMIQMYREDGTVVPVTVLEAGPCSVQVVKVEGKDGYNSVQLGYEDMKEQRLKKPQREYLKANKLEPRKFVREIRCDETPDVKTGDQITNKIFQQGDYLDVTGISKGKGFQGGVKRWGWAGGKASHGSMGHRRPGSIGASAYPSRVFKGHNMPGHMGTDKVTIQNLEVIDVDTEHNTVIVKGSIPGANGTYLVIRYAKKKPLAERVQVEEPEEEQPQEEQPQGEQVQQEQPQEEKPKEEPVQEEVADTVGASEESTEGAAKPEASEEEAQKEAGAGSGEEASKEGNNE